MMEIHAPLFECLEKSKIRILGNMHIAHPHRDWRGNFLFLMERVQESDASM